jgi:hypothetical protein
MVEIAKRGTRLPRLDAISFLKEVFFSVWLDYFLVSFRGCLAGKAEEPAMFYSCRGRKD